LDFDLLTNYIFCEPCSDGSSNGWIKLKEMVLGLWFLAGLAFLLTIKRINGSWSLNPDSQLLKKMNANLMKMI